jgi:hypothetical protein
MSSCLSQSMAWPLSSPHMSTEGRSEAQTAGRSGRPKSLHRNASSSCGQGTPAGLPRGAPLVPKTTGIELEIEGAMQQAPQPGRQSMGVLFHVKPGGDEAWQLVSKPSAAGQADQGAKPSGKGRCAPLMSPSLALLLYFALQSAPCTIPDAALRSHPLAPKMTGRAVPLQVTDPVRP